VGLAVLVVVGVIAAAVVRPGASNPGAPGGSGSVSATTLSTALPTSALKVQSSLVALIVVTPNGQLHGCAVVVSGNGLIATTVDAVKSARSIVAVTSDGTHEPARIVATDSRSDVALLKMPDDLPAAQFVDDGKLNTNTPTFVMELTGRVRGATRHDMQWAGARIGWIGDRVVGGLATGMSGIEAWVGRFPSIAGEALVDTSGQVAGILDPSAKAAAASAVFLPASLVFAVAQELAVGGHVQHGWLDIKGRDAGTSSRVSGAIVVSVAPHGPAISALQDGDVIESIDSEPVRSMAELRSRLYVLAPGAHVTLLVLRRGARRTADVNLAGSP